jgi:hypothetical protein
MFIAACREAATMGKMAEGEALVAIIAVDA